MGSTNFLLDRMAAPLRRLYERACRARTQARLGRIRALASAGNRIQQMPGHGHVAWPPTPAATPRRVRVLRIVDAGFPASAAGRLVVSGRLADVCAELDRMVALEGAAA